MNKITIPLIAFLFFSKMLVAQVDTVPPVIVCKQNLEFYFYPTGLVTIWVSDFIDTVYDNTGGNIEFGIRKVCTGSGFPENKNNVTFSAHEMGYQTVEIWARDAAENTAMCNTKILVLDHDGNIDPHISLTLMTPNNEGIDKSTVEVKGGHCSEDSVDYQISVYAGSWSVPGHW